MLQNVSQILHFFHSFLTFLSSGSTFDWRKTQWAGYVLLWIIISLIILGLPLGDGAQLLPLEIFTCGICWLREEKGGNNFAADLSQKYIELRYQANRGKRFPNIDATRRVTCLSSTLKMAALHVAWSDLKHPCSSFVLNSTDCYKFCWRALYKQMYWGSLSCLVSSTLNCFLCNLAYYLQPQSIASKTKISSVIEI